MKIVTTGPEGARLHAHALRMELDGYQPRDAKFTFPEQRDVAPSS